MGIFFIAIYLICTGIYFFMGISTFFKDTNSSTNKAFFVLCVILSIWSLITANMMAAPDAETAALYRNISTVCWSILYCNVLHLILHLTGKAKKLNNKITTLIFVPGIMSILLYAINPFTAEDMVRSIYGWGFYFKTQSIFLWNNIFNLYFIVYLILDLVLIINWGKNSKFKREKKQATIITFSFFSTLLLAIVSDFLMPYTGMKFMPPIAVLLVSVAITGVWYSLIRYKFNTLSDEKVILDVFKIMNEGFIILDYEGTIQSINRHAENLLKYKEGELVGKPLHHVLAKKSEWLVQIGFSSVELELLSKDNEKLTVLASYSILQDKMGEKLGEKLGAVLIFQDIFEIKQVQHRLAAARDNLEVAFQQSSNELAITNVKLEKEIQHRLEKEEEIETLASKDQLTGLPNRRYFSERLNEAISFAAKKDGFLGVLLMDIDGFTFINDSLGYEYGDEILKEVSKRIQGLLSEDDIMARVGGDEFSILLKDLKSKEQITNICSEILSVVKEPFEFNKGEVFVSISIGGSVYPIDGIDANTLVKNADIAMTSAKDNGKGIFELCNSRMKSSLNEVMELTHDLYKALEAKELELYYQPQVNIKTEEIVGVEALIRWHHPKLGMIRPDIFIPIAEKTGLIGDIGEWVIRTACSQKKAWENQGIYNISVAVNISVNQLRSRGIVKQIVSILSETGIDPKDFELEITENVFIRDKDYIIQLLRELRKMKIRIAIDDFGIEYSSWKAF